MEDLEDKFLNASKEGDLKMMKRLVANEGVDVDCREKDYPKCCAIHHAASKGHLNVVKWLIKSGVDKEVEDMWTPLICASDEGSINVVKFLILELGVNINHSDESRETALHRSAFSGHRGICEILLQNGAALKCKNSDGKIPEELIKSEDRKLLAPVFKVVGAFEKERLSMSVRDFQELKDLRKLKEFKKDTLVQEKEKKVTEMSDNLEMERASRKRLKVEVHSLKKEMKAKEKFYIQTLKAKIADLKRKLKEEEAKKLGEKSMEIQQYSQVLQNTQHQLQEQTKQKEDALKKITKLETKMKKREKMLKDYGDQFKKYKEIDVKKDQRFQKVKAEVVQLRKFKEKVRGLENLVKEKNDQLAKFSDDFNIIKQELDKQILKSRPNHLKKNKKNNKKKIEDLETELLAQQDLIKMKDEQIMNELRKNRNMKKVEDECEQLKQQVETYRNENGELQLQLAKKKCTIL